MDSYAAPATGYLHERYVQSLAEFGTPLRLKRCGGWLIARAIPATRLNDAIGPYPLFTCRDFGGLAADLAALPSSLVAVSLVADPFGDYDPCMLERSFDFASPYKNHHVVDLSVPFDAYVRHNHRRNARLALRDIDVHHPDDPTRYLDEWCALYQHLCERHAITGLRAFSRKAFLHQLNVPGCHYFRAVHGGSAVAALVCYVDRGIAYSHLSAADAQGRKLRAHYALYWRAIEFFRARARWFNLGASPMPAAEAAKDGLAYFKAGWATHTRPAWFCGRILDRSRYDALCAQMQIGERNYFPAYRAGRFD